ncbi:bifunctional 4-hydroxy-2-oxoglutarate aldolase/2-dehydro-3-deoxy-phosphogluconate aldolase [Microbaculum marinum]|uniref:2-dehydro-3-deoxy-phosphogluconate aldolase n=1 Tax=Microbaculum marinum TaxID=1764581 RepID=A0AAW9RE45_9HYPH
MGQGSETDVMSALAAAGIVPVVTITDADAAVALAGTLVDAGLPVIEITLRTEAALEAIRRIAAEVPGAVVGAGTIRRPADIEASLEAGARFLVSPGTPPELARAALEAPVPFLPGCATPSEAMTLAELGFGTLKFFPAAAYGGPAALKAFAAPLAGISFVPTGGVAPDNLETYLKLPNVPAVGGSWMVNPEWVESGDFARIAAETLTASTLARRIRT